MIGKTANGHDYGKQEEGVTELIVRPRISNLLTAEGLVPVVTAVQGC